MHQHLCVRRQVKILVIVYFVKKNFINKCSKERVNLECVQRYVTMAQYMMCP
jgi:hypothetical protein